MISASDLSEEQIATIKKWVADGDQMADVQKKLKEEFDLNATYMDTRFLSLDLELDFHSDEPEEVEVIPEAEAAPAPAPTPMSPLDPAAGGVMPPAGGVSATLDQVARPGAMVSGTVTFSDGMKALWLIDEMGRPSIDPDQPGYTPSEADLMSFQKELQGLLDGHV